MKIHCCYQVLGRKEANVKGTITSIEKRIKSTFFTKWRGKVLERWSYAVLYINRSEGERVQRDWEREDRERE